MAENKITTVVFDIGNVLLRWDPGRIFKDLFGRDDYKSHPLRSIVGNRVWLKLDRGTISQKEGIDILGREYPEEKETIRQFMDAIPDHVTPIIEGIRCAEKCKENGYKILLLSNFPEYAYVRVRKKHSFFRIFDGEVISYQVNMIKPEEEIYKELLNRFSIIPEQTLFLDDTEENIAGAEKVGIKGLLVRNPETAARKLKEITGI